MSSDEEFNESGRSANQVKKRRLQRACDICRRKKVRCDGPQMPGNRCSNCISCDLQCTYVEAAKKRGPPKGYVEALENRLDKLQRLLHRFVPDLDFTKELDDTPCESLSTAAKTLDSYYDHNVRSPTSIATGAIQKTGRTSYEGDEEWDAHVIIPDRFSKLQLSNTHNRFFGKSSGAILVQTAINLKAEFVDGDKSSPHVVPPLDFVREEFWTSGSWESPLVEDSPTNYEFPDGDLIDQLVDLYFTQVNVFTPFLHRPTFEKDIAEQKHLVDDDFASILLLVCAVASRYTDDPRVLLEPGQLYSAGWQWFHQVQVVKKSLFRPAHLVDLQYCCLTVQFLLGSSAPQACWTLVGVGIRVAQDVGAHRRSTHRGPWTMNDELWKRAFWALVSMDRQISATLGRPCATQDEDFDIDLPIECDDEYWEQDEAGDLFKQPLEKPSTVTFFNSYLKLNQILNMALRTIYCINKSRILLGFVGPQWEQHIVSELDSALNKWVDSIPDHLRWDPNREDPIFYAQSLRLYTSYYHLQIIVHRPFISLSRKNSPLSFPSLAICTNAARACAHLVDLDRLYPCVLPELQMPIFTSGIVSLLTIYAGRRSGLTTDPAKEMTDVYKCMDVLKCCEQRWQAAGRLWDILYELASVGELPLPLASPPLSQKRERGSDSPKSTRSDTAPQESPPGSATSTGGTGARPCAGDKRAANSRKKGSNNQYPPPPLPAPAPQQGPPQTEIPNFPLYSSELGRLPIHPQQGEYWYPSTNLPVSNAGAPFSTAYETSSMGQQPAQRSSSHSLPAFSMPAMTPTWTQPLAQYHTQDEYYRSTTTTMPLGQPHAPSTFGAGYYPQENTALNPLIDQDMLHIWTSAPTGYELEDWGTYLNNVSEMTHQSRHAGDNGQHR